MGNTKGTDNDSYDVIFKNEPSGDNLHLHLKENSNSMSFPGTFYEAFTSGDGKAHFAAEINSQNFHVHEIRSMDNGGTPIAQRVGDQLEVGEIAYQPNSDQFIGMKANGETIAFGN